MLVCARFSVSGFDTCYCLSRFSFRVLGHAATQVTTPQGPWFDTTIRRPRQVAKTASYLYYYIYFFVVSPEPRIRPTTGRIKDSCGVVVVQTAAIMPYMASKKSLSFRVPPPNCMIKSNYTFLFVGDRAASLSTNPSKGVKASNPNATQKP